MFGRHHKTNCSNSSDAIREWQLRRTGWVVFLGLWQFSRKWQFECQNLRRERQGHRRYTWQGTSHSPRASLLKKAAPVRGVGEQSTENGSMRQVGRLVGTLRGYKRPESTVRTAEEPSPLLPSPQGMAEGLLQIPLQALPLQGRAGL